MAFQIIQRRDYLHNWSTAEAASPPTGNLRRGEIAIAIVTSDGTDTGDIVEVIGRIGPSDTPTPFSDCPVVFRSPRGFKGADVRPVLMPDTPAEGAVVAYDPGTGSFQTITDDPGSYEDDADGEDDGSGDGETVGDVAPTILLGLVDIESQQLDFNETRTWGLSLEVDGQPDPELVIEVDYVETNPDNITGVPNVVSKVYEFSSSSLPTGITLTTSSNGSMSQALGSKNFAFGGFEITRDSRVNVSAIVRVVAVNAAGSSPVSEFNGAATWFRDLSGPQRSAPRIESLAIQQGGQTISSIANLATDGTTTLTASIQTSGWTDGVDGGTVSYQWYRDGAALVGETSATLAVTNTADIYNDTSVSVDVTIANDLGDDTRSAYVSIGAAENGWTDFTQYLEADSRIMYVAANGDDSTGVVYAPDDPALGSDPMQPTGAVQAFATYEAARSHMRDFKADWILFRRGDTFVLPRGLVSFQNGNHFMQHDPAGPTIRKVFGSYGPLSDDRPVITTSGSFVVTGFGTDSKRYGNLAFVSLDLRAPGVEDNTATISKVSGVRNLHFEDCRLRGGNAFIQYDWNVPDIRYSGGIVFRRCTIVDAARSSGGHVQGLYGSYVEGMTIEECLFDRNGYVQDPTDPSTWTGKLLTDNQNSDPTAVGEGVQPFRTWFSRNFYLSSYKDLHIRGSIFSRSASAHQMRAGGVAERNVFLWNDQALAPKTQGRDPDFLSGQTLSQNLVLHEDHLLAQALQAGGMTASVGETHEAIVRDNVVADFNRASTYFYASMGLEASGDHPAEKGDKVTFSDNVGYSRSGSGMNRLQGTSGAWSNGFIVTAGSGNQIAIESPEYLVMTTVLTNPAEWTYGNNHYLPGQYQIGLPFDKQNLDFAAWQAAGFDAGSTQYADIASMASALGWQTTTDAQGRLGWERDIVSYMESIDPTYIVDENVTVDDGVPVANRRANAPKVWEVLAGQHAPSANLNSYLSEADAKLTARRYHAFLTFIERARANRKGAWDERYTADALNNHIRAGFGKTPVGGAYTALLPGEAV